MSQIPFNQIFYLILYLKITLKEALNNTMA